jgi:hypothetical protein
MNAIDIHFKTDRFNVSKVGKHFINPCCFGEDLAAWLRTKLVDTGIEVSKPGQEDWGWYLQVKTGADSYLLGVRGNSEENSANPNCGDWGIIVHKHRSLWKMLTGKGHIANDDAVLCLIEDIISRESDFRGVRRDAGVA